MAPAERLARQWHRHEPRVLVAEAGLVVSDDIIDWLAEHPGMMLVNPLGRKLAVVGEADNVLGGQYYETSPYGIGGGFYYLKASYQF